MQRLFAVSFKYYGATNTLPSRWRLECLGERKFVSYDYSRGDEQFRTEEGIKFLVERFHFKPNSTFVCVGSCCVGGLEVYLFDYSEVEQ